MSDLEATLQLIQEESSITSLLDVFVGTSTPMVLIGTFPEEETALPAISIRGLPKDVQFGISTTLITVSCYAATENEGQQVANAVNEFFRDSQGGVSGFAARFESSITGNVNDADQSGIIVELTLTYR